VFGIIRRKDGKTDKEPKKPKEGHDVALLDYVEATMDDPTPPYCKKEISMGTSIYRAARRLVFRDQVDSSVVKYSKVPQYDM